MSAHRDKAGHLTAQTEAWGGHRPTVRSLRSDGRHLRTRNFVNVRRRHVHGLAAALGQLGC